MAAERTREPSPARQASRPALTTRWACSLRSSLSRSSRTAKGERGKVSLRNMSLRQSATMGLSVGILIIGSLYWDQTCGRSRWRRKRLQAGHEWLVRVPIRYRRLSKSRGNTYTMVFDDLSETQLGTAKVLQCQRSVTTSACLIAEAEWLWAAERKDVPCLSNSPKRIISAGWGCVALLYNHQISIPAEIVEGWAQRVASEHAANNKHLVNARGLLQIPWPNLVEGTPITQDLLLATSTNPKPRNEYPDATRVANAWLDANDASYFRRNRENGIHTFQDEEIEQHLARPRT